MLTAATAPEFLQGRRDQISEKRDEVDCLTSQAPPRRRFNRRKGRAAATACPRSASPVRCASSRFRRTLPLAPPPATPRLRSRSGDDDFSSPAPCHDSRVSPPLPETAHSAVRRRRALKLEDDAIGMVVGDGRRAAGHRRARYGDLATWQPDALLRRSDQGSQSTSEQLPETDADNASPAR